MPSPPTPILIVHPEPEVRAAIEQAARRLAEGAVSIHQATSPADALASARRLDPALVFLELDEQTDLALDAARELRRPGRTIAGLYNPLLRRATEGELFRAAARAGVADFVPLPAPEEEIRAVMEAAASPGSEAAPGSRVVAFFGHKGGVGTTTLAVSTALAAAAADRGEVVLCDADLQFGAAVAHLGLAPQQDLATLARDLGHLDALSTYVEVHPPSGLRVLASPRDPLDADRVTPEEMSRILIALRQRFGLVVADTASQVDLMTLAVLDLADSVFVVTEAVAPTVLGTARLLRLLEAQGLGGERLRVVLNRFTGGDENLAPELVSEWLGREVDHLVEYDRAVPVAANRGEPLVLDQPKSSLARAAARLAGETA